jgi:crotonobetainyl-CoA:carnitine CoA-transferase CaiB-like acyl-CoA transferase
VPDSALDGLRIVDLSQGIAGPYCTKLLADLGADVVKIEPPDGDQWRKVDDVRGESRVFHAVNRGKRGAVIDLRTDEGRRDLLDLVRGADVVVHSFAPGVAERIGAGPAELMAANPRLVYCSLSAFGPDGPRGTDVALQSEAGVVTANGGRPLPVPVHDTLVP